MRRSGDLRGCTLVMASMQTNDCKSTKENHAYNATYNDHEFPQCPPITQKRGSHSAVVFAFGIGESLSRARARARVHTHPHAHAPTNVCQMCVRVCVFTPVCVCVHACVARRRACVYAHLAKHCIAF